MNREIRRGGRRKKGKIENKVFFHMFNRILIYMQNLVLPIFFRYPNNHILPTSLTICCLVAIHQNETIEGDKINYIHPEIFAVDGGEGENKERNS